MRKINKNSGSLKVQLCDSLSKYVSQINKLNVHHVELAIDFDVGIVDREGEGESLVAIHVL